MGISIRLLLADLGTFFSNRSLRDCGHQHMRFYMVRSRTPLSSSKIVDAPLAAMPSSVKKAMQIDFGWKITAYLSCVEYGAGELYLQGIVFRDRENRFDDGDPIRTSIIMASEQIQGYLVVQTLSSRYVVCDWAGKGAEGSCRSQH